MSIKFIKELLKYNQVLLQGNEKKAEPYKKVIRSIMGSI